MALNVAYFSTTDDATKLCYGPLLSSVAYTVTGSSASVGTPPAWCNIARITAGEGCYISNNGLAASSTNGVYLAAGSVIDIYVEESKPIQAITG